jgi:competence protein ComEC
MKNIKQNLRWCVLVLLFIANFFVWYAVFSEERGGLLTVAFLDVGQGDAIFIEAPNGNQTLVDGGPDKKVLRGLSEIMPFYDHSIDVVVATHPDQDHIGGLPDVLKKFKVGAVMEPGVKSYSESFKAFENISKNKGIKKIFARRGQRIILDESVYIDILFPDRDTFGWDANNASVVAKVVYGDTSFLLTGDSPKRIEGYLVLLDGENLKTDVLKLGHHGSRTSTSGLFLSAAEPKIVVISAGKNNRYGHPHRETEKMLEDFKIDSLATYKKGTIIIKSDGNNVKIGK